MSNVSALSALTNAVPVSIGIGLQKNVVDVGYLFVDEYILVYKKKRKKNNLSHLILGAYLWTIRTSNTFLEMGYGMDTRDARDKATMQAKWDAKDIENTWKRY
jgi:hypothetical protein